MPRITWLPDALANVEWHHAFLHEKSPDASARAARIILESALQSMPEVGRPIDDDTGRRKLVLSFGAGAFELRSMRDRHDSVVIIHVWHSKESQMLSQLTP